MSLFGPTQIGQTFTLFLRQALERDTRQVTLAGILRSYLAATLVVTTIAPCSAPDVCEE